MEPLFCYEHSIFNSSGAWDVYIYFAIIVGILIIYGVCMAVSGGVSIDFLNKAYFDVPVIGTFGGWSLSHVITFYIAGLLFPQQWVLIFILGVFWELLESLIGEIAFQVLGEVPESKKSYKVMYTSRWINGNISDIWYNTIGLFLGYVTADIYFRITGKKIFK